MEKFAPYERHLQNVAAGKEAVSGDDGASLDQRDIAHGGRV